VVKRKCHRQSVSCHTKRDTKIRVVVFGASGCICREGTPTHWSTCHVGKLIQIYIEKAGFTILDYSEAYPYQRFYDIDIGAIVYYLKSVPWQVPDFLAEKYRDKLGRMHEMIEKYSCIEVKSHRFYIIASV
jgi:hypothetical protein